MPKIALDPKLAGQLFANCHNELTSFAKGGDNMNALLNDIQKMTFSNPINEAAVKVNEILNTVIHGHIEGHANYLNPLAQVHNAWITTHATGANRLEFTKPVFEGSRISQVTNDRVEAEPAALRAKKEEIVGLYKGVLKTSSQNLTDHIMGTKSFWLGNSADMSRNTFTSKVLPLNDHLDQAIARLGETLEQHIADIEAFDNGTYVE